MCYMFCENLYSAVWCALSTAFRTTRGDGKGRRGVEGVVRGVTGGSLQVFAAASSAHAALYVKPKLSFAFCKRNLSETIES